MPSDLTILPDFPLEKTYGYSTQITKFENGTEQRRPTRNNSITGWHLLFKTLSATDKNTICALYESCKGSYASFTWDNPEDGSTYTVRFKDDSLKVSHDTAGAWKIEVDILLVL